MIEIDLFFWIVFGVGIVTTILVVSFGIVEIIAVKVLKIDRRPGLNPYHPVFTFGNFYNVSRLSELQKGPEGPHKYGYFYNKGTYLYDPKIEKPNILKRTEFVFAEGHEHSISRTNNYDNGEVRIFIIGGSTASGAGASSKSNTWSSLLEQNLKDRIKHNIVVFNAAVGSYATCQERLCLELAVLPRKPDMVIMLNGQNDVEQPLSGNTRPGDPPTTGLMYANLYHPITRSFLEKSAVLRYLAHSNYVMAGAKNRQRNLGDPQRIDLLVGGIISTYYDNMAAMYDRCKGLNIDCIGFLQPNRSLTQLSQGNSDQIAETDAYMGELYRAWRSAYIGITTKMIQSPYQNQFVSLENLMNSYEISSVYLDSCHFTDGGQEICAKAIGETIIPRLEKLILKKIRA
ncbi:MAG: SGNH/GDSL hydrolase family protein [Pseudomonadota bacterium]|nr:SGNH/GDSL hydrolase family protein [Pseudomonadota bacterium]